MLLIKNDINCYAGFKRYFYVKINSWLAEYKLKYIAKFFKNGNGHC